MTLVSDPEKRNPLKRLALHSAAALIAGSALPCLCAFVMVGPFVEFSGAPGAGEISLLVYAPLGVAAALNGAGLAALLASLLIKEETGGG